MIARPCPACPAPGNDRIRNIRWSDGLIELIRFNDGRSAGARNLKSTQMLARAMHLDGPAFLRFPNASRS